MLGKSLGVVLRRIIIAAICIVVMASMFGIRLFAQLDRSPGKWRNPPSYPYAQHVKVQDFGEAGKLLPEAGNIVVIKIITFTVADEVGSIEAFYIDNLTRSGWKQDTWGMPSKAPNKLNFSWNSGERSSSIYFIDVTATPLSTGGADVEIGISLFPGY